MKVSVIVPTRAREACLQRVARCFAHQTHRDAELLILDDSPAPSPYFAEAEHGDARVRYFHTREALPLGAKRNWLIERATGEVVMHFDDDDYYAPRYVARMLDGLAGQDFFKLSGWYCYHAPDRFLAYMDAEPESVRDARACFLLFPQHPVSVAPIGPEQRELLGHFRWAYGFSYAYRKDAWARAPLPEVDFQEDAQFVARLRASGARLACAADREGLVLHVIHAMNSSGLIAQYAPPAFVLESVFGADVAPYVAALSSSSESPAPDR